MKVSFVIGILIDTQSCTSLFSINLSECFATVKTLQLRVGDKKAERFTNKLKMKGMIDAHNERTRRVRRMHSNGVLKIPLFIMRPLMKLIPHMLYLK